VVVGQFDKSEVGASETITEPSADRGPQRGYSAGVVDAPDAKLNSEYPVNSSNYHHPNLSLASGATALGSVKPRHLGQVQTDPLPNSAMLFFHRHKDL
jgi:hypothetical protein